MSGAEAHGGRWLRALRLRAGLSIEQTALAADTSPDYLAALEEGVETASPSFLRHLTNVIASELIELQAPGHDGVEKSPAPLG